MLGNIKNLMDLMDALGLSVWGCGSFLRKGEVSAYVGRNQNLNDRKWGEGFGVLELAPEACCRNRTEGVGTGVSGAGCRAGCAPGRGCRAGRGPSPS